MMTYNLKNQCRSFIVDEVMRDMMFTRQRSKRGRRRVWINPFYVWGFVAFWEVVALDYWWEYQSLSTCHKCMRRMIILRFPGEPKIIFLCRSCYALEKAKKQ